jgi:glycerophosphoryl diester phosphodiesterase
VDGHLPAGVEDVGVEIALLRRDPRYVSRARARGYEVHAWTANSAADIDFCLELGITSLTSDHPDQVAARMPAVELVPGRSTAHSGWLAGVPPTR